MNQEISAYGLRDIETALNNEEIRSAKPLRCDRYIASSILQKSIRRSDQRTAARAAVTLWQLDKVAFWRRLSVICAEDCVASVDETAKVLMAFNNPAWRAKTGDLKIGLYLVRLLCQGVKLRLGDEIYSIVGNAPELKKLRELLAKASNPYLADTVLDTKRPLEERALALWFLAGTRRYEHENMPERIGSLDWVAEVLVAMNVATDLTQACIANLTKTRWPLSLFMPLFVSEIEKHSKAVKVVCDKFPVSLKTQGIPLVALDGFTRLGKSNFLELQRSISELKPFTQKQIALGVFYTEGYCVEKRLTSTWLEDIRQRGEIADMEASGLDLPRHMALREILMKNTNSLNDIRVKGLKSYLERLQADFFEEDEND